MNGSSIELKSIYDLLKDDEGSPARFFIPAYQRGYRWTPLQVTQLLEDIWDFINPKNGQQRGKFYCLQPIVIGSADEEHFEVVDGQQRLTTILLILRFFNDRLVEKSRKALYTIAFETRQGFDDFLENPTDENASENIDFYHLHEAIEAITDWFEGKDNVVHDIESALLNKTKVIWFQLSEEDDPIAAFTRLNVGKIPLTSDELIRALFLKGTNSDEKTKRVVN